MWPLAGPVARPQSERDFTFISSTARVKPGLSGPVRGPVMRAILPAVDEHPDIALITGPTEDGEGVRVVRFRDEEVTAGEVRPMQEGKPLAVGAEIVRLKPRAGTEAPAFDGERIYKRPAQAAPASRGVKGPAKVSTSAYRSNWEMIFGAPSSKEDTAPN